MSRCSRAGRNSSQAGRSSTHGGVVCKRLFVLLASSDHVLLSSRRYKTASVKFLTLLVRQVRLGAGATLLLRSNLGTASLLVCTQVGEWLCSSVRQRAPFCCVTVSSEAHRYGRVSATKSPASILFGQRSRSGLVRLRYGDACFDCERPARSFFIATGTVPSQSPRWGKHGRERLHVLRQRL